MVESIKSKLTLAESAIKPATETKTREGIAGGAIPSEEDKDEDDMMKRVATPEEEHRFKNIFNKECEEKVKAYLAWRQEFSLDDEHQDNPLPPRCANDAELWNWALAKAWDYYQQNPTTQSPENNSDNKVKQGSFRKFKKNRRNASEKTLSTTEETSDDNFLDKSTTSTSTLQTCDVPQVVYCHERNGELLRDRQGHRVLHVLAARLDPSIPDASTLYTSAIALYLDRLLDRHSDERVTLLLDVRPGVGWANPPALDLVGLVRHAAERLHALYPDRLHRCVLFPVPRPAIFIWNIMKVFLDESVRSAVRLIAGGAQVKTPLPRQDLSHHVDESCLEYCEQVRLSCFVE